MTDDVDAGYVPEPTEPPVSRELHKDFIELLAAGREKDASYYYELRRLRDDMQAVIERAWALNTERLTVNLMELVRDRIDRVAPAGIYDTTQPELFGNA